MTPSGHATSDRPQRLVATFAEEILTPYRYDFLERLRERLDERGVGFRYLHGGAGPGHDGGPPWVEHMRQWHLNMGDRRLVWQSPGTAARRSDLLILDEGARLLSSVYYLLGQPRNVPRVALWGHGLVSSGTGSMDAAFAARRWTARLPAWWFAYTEGSARRLASAGFPRDRVTVVNNAIDTTALSGHLRSLQSGGLLRAPHRCVFVGTLYHRKRLDYLLAAGDHLARRCPGFVLDVVGDGEMRSDLARAAASRPWLQLVGRRSGRSLVEVLARAQLVLAPASVGLSVLDSFATETPLVAVLGLGHGPELEYMQPGRNGFLLPEGTTPLGYADYVCELLSQTGRVESARAGCRESASVLTLDRMVDSFVAGIIAALAQRPARAGASRLRRSRFPDTSGRLAPRGRRGTAARSSRPSP